MTTANFLRCVNGDQYSCLSTFWCKKNNFTLMECSFCNHAFVGDPVSPSGLADYYESRTKYSQGFDEDLKNQNFPGSRSDAIRYLSLITKWLGKTGQRISFLEVGAGWAYASRIASCNGWQVDAIEYSPFCASSLRQALPQGSLIWEGSYESFSEQSSKSYNAILMSQVLEHAINPREWLLNAHRMLRPGGILVIAVPQYKGIYRFLGSNDPFIIPPEHLNFFSRRSLSNLATNVGFEVACVQGYSRIPFSNLCTRLKVRLLALLVYRLLQFSQFFFDSLGISGVQIQVLKKVR